MDKFFIKELWEKLTGENFSTKALFEIIQFDGGLDTSSISEEIVASLLEEDIIEDFSELVFPFSELLAYYSAMGKLQPEQIVAWVFSAFIISEAVRRKYTDWELQFDIIMNGFAHIVRYDPFFINIDDKMFILSKILNCKDSE